MKRLKVKYNESLIITSIEMDQTNMVLKINRQSRVVNAGMKRIHDGLSSFSWVQLAEFFLLQELAPS